MTTTVHVGDLHLSDTPPGYRTDTYREDVLDKLSWVMAEATSRQAEAVLLVGDIFHHKRNVSHGLVADLSDVLALFPGQKYVLPGNHDMVDNDPDVSRRPLGVLGRMPQVTVATEDFLVGSTLAVHPVPWSPRATLADLPFPATDDLGRWRLVWAHLAIAPTSLPYEAFLTDSPDWPDLEADAMFVGHLHEDFGGWQDRHGMPCFNLGSLSRGSLTTDNLERSPRVLVSSWPEIPLADDPDTTPTHSALTVPCRPAAEAFRLEDKEAAVQGERVAEEFLASLGETQIRQMNAEDIRAGIEALNDVPEPVRAKALEAVEAAFG